jgi:hypothetical protein
MRAAFGQYTTDDKQTRRDHSRLWFLEAAVEIEPQLPPTLFEIYRDFQDRVRFDFGTNFMEQFIGFRLGQLIELRHPLAEVRRSVENWARRFNLTKSGSAPEWILQCAFRSFSRWQNGLCVVELAMPSVSAILPDIDRSIVPPEFTRKQWNPFFGGTRNQFEKDLNAHLKSVKEFVIRRLDEIENAAKAAGCKAAPTNLDPDRYTWAAQYQVAGIEVSEFRERFSLHKEPRGTRLAIHAILDEVGLTRRPPKNIGRRKKRKVPSQE